MSDSGKLKDLIQHAASSITMANVEDLSDIEGLESVLDDIASCIEEISDLSDSLKSETASATSTASDLVKSLLSQQSDDADVSLKAVSDTVVALQSLTDQIEKGTELSDISIEFPTASDAESSSATVTETESEDPADVEETSGEFLIDDDDIELIADFITEAAEHIEAAEAGLLEIESNPEDSEAINLIFRAFHTIKGMAGFLNLADLGSLAHVSENLLDLSRKGELKLVGASMDVIFESLDLLKAMIAELKAAIESSKIVPPTPALPSLLEKLKACAEGTAVADEPSSEVSETPAAQDETTASETTVEESASVREDVAADTEDVSPDTEDVCDVEKPAVAEVSVAESPVSQQEATPSPVTPANAPDPVPVAAKQAGGAKPKQAVTEEKIKVSTSRLDSLVNMVGELVIAQSMVSQDAEATLKADHDLCRNIGHQGKIVRELQELSMMMRMVPIQGVFQKMARLVRDLCQKSGKKVIFSTEGEETELDRIVVDQISDPLVHMIRNSIDHGIESEEDRVKAGKDPKGHVQLRAFHQAGNIVIEIVDDGKGLNKEKILKKAIDNGIVQAGQDISDQDIYKLIFHAGLSTAEKVTEVSGRGVGMDVVRKNIESLRGKVDIDSEEGRGSVFTIRLPLTMAIIEGQVVRIGDDRYVIPIISIVKSFRPTAEQIKTIGGKVEIAAIHGDLLPMARLYNLLDVEPSSKDPTEASLVVVEEDGVRGCLMVDELLG
ncbi:MAG TPA: chemotaxis protein CheA, partial [Phycisphaerales bacterium]|nr:chemotaxis protein CheA [Phycisphaerales bacterium]